MIDFTKYKEHKMNTFLNAILANIFVIWKKAGVLLPNIL